MTVSFVLKKVMKSADSKLYILLTSIHGLIRGNELELGSDADTGGQTLYVVDLARAWVNWMKSVA